MNKINKEIKKTLTFDDGFKETSSVVNFTVYLISEYFYKSD